jgi:hypothetical protein
MAEPGGSAAINGFLYQILANLWQIAKIRLSDVKRRKEDIYSARLILEPKGGGGDARYEVNGVRIVEQYKKRSEKKKWSLKEIIKDVLPDLFIAVDPHRLHEECKYHFVTDGCRGNIDEFDRFLKTLKNLSPNTIPEDPLSVLDNTQKLLFGKQHLTDQAFFSYIADVVKPPNDNASPDLHYRKVWHLLSRFEIHDNLSMFELKYNINEQLRTWGLDDDEIESKRHELCGILMKLSARGNVECTPQDILESAGLNVSPLSTRNFLLEGICSGVRCSFCSRMARRLSYFTFNRRKWTGKNMAAFSTC